MDEARLGLPSWGGWDIMRGKMYEELIALLKSHSRFAVIAHFRPDGDALGSTIALSLALRALGKTVTLYNEDTLPSHFAFLEGGADLQPIPDCCPEELEVLICLDNGAWKRLGDKAIATFAVARDAGKGPILVNLDHHGSNELYGQLNLVEPKAAATGCIIYKIIEMLDVDFSPAMASALYVAISTDTGSFQYGSTTPEVMRMAAHLIECGVDVQDVNRRLYQEIPLSVLMVNREVLNHMVVEHGGFISHYSLEADVKAALGISDEDSKDLVDIVRVIEGVKASIIFEDLDDGRVRMSLRSKDPRVNVARVATLFGGGGHAMAAGIRMSAPLTECRALVLQALRAEIDASIV